MARRLRNFLWLNFAQEANLEERRSLRLERRRIRDSQNPFSLRDEDFVGFFRVSKDIARYLCDSLEPMLRRERSSGLNIHVQVLATLRFLAEGSYQRGVGQDFLLALSQPSVSRCVFIVIGYICDLLGHWIKFPQTNEEMAAIEVRFRPTVRFPGVIGAIDCTHISIVTPLVNPEGYRNRKGFFSLNTQMICDDRMVIRNVTIYPGSVHDQFIWNFSQPKEVMRDTQGTYFLLGDSGYALEPWLMTPIPDAMEGTPDFRYTLAHCKTRSVVERLFGVLKGRWRCLLKDRVLHYSPERASKIILCCAILHNIMVHHGLPDPPEAPENHHLPQEEHRGDMEHGDNLTVGRRNRINIINQYFR